MIKKCRRCKVEFEFNNDNFYKIKKNESKLQVRCKSCVNELHKNYVRKNKDRVYETRKIYISKNIEKTREYQKQYREKNKEKANKYSLEYKTKRRKSDPIYRINCSFRSRLYQLTTGEKLSFSCLPFTSEELRSHLEKQFNEEMSWENYGSVWHVDHIIPVSSFKNMHKGSDDFYLCWSLCNLRPLLTRDNLSKGNKRTNLI